MIRSMLSRGVLAGCLLVGQFFVSACGSDTVSEAAADGGTVSLPLIAEANGHRYRLANANVLVSGPTSLWLSSNSEESELTATLPTGGYFAELFWGWTLERDDGSGNFSRVQATLVSSPYASFSIFQGTTTTVAFRFETDGVVVTVGAGDLRIAIDVGEIPAVCTPFGDECGPGAWCPPSGLTRMPRACFGEGTVPVGEACSSPSECVANASCFDLGAGPVCAELCPAAAFDGPCESGGTCIPSAEDYGVCRPAAE